MSDPTSKLWKWKPAELVICRRHMLYLHKITFSGRILANRNRLGRKFTGTHRVTWHAPLQSFGALSLVAAKWRRKKRIFRTFCQRNNARRFTHFPGDDFREILTQNVNRCHHQNFRNWISKFFWKGVLHPSDFRNLRTAFILGRFIGLTAYSCTHSYPDDLGLFVPITHI